MENNMKKLNNHNLDRVKINNSKNFRIRDEEGEATISYRGSDLATFLDGIPMLSRKLGYRIPLDELRKIDVMFLSVEENQNNELFHKNYYFTLKKIENGITGVIIKHFDVPMQNMGVNTADYLQMAKNIVNQNPSFIVATRPNYELTMDHMMKPNCFRFRPNVYNSYFFEAEFDVFTYGELCMKVDTTIRRIENQIRTILTSNTP